MSTLQSLFSVEAWQWRIGRRLRPAWRGNWPARPPTRPGARPRIAVVTVNYNTRLLLARLVFSLRRLVDDSVEVGPIVVVDNKSTDGSVDLIRELTAAGLVESVLNDVQRYHGPGLNQGVELLRRKAAAGVPGFADIDHVFVVDSDVFICRGELFAHALAAMTAAGTPMAGEFEANEYIPGGYAHVSSLLFDPAVLWRRGLHPFEEHGVPALEFQRSMIRAGRTRLDFPFRSHFYLVHLWSGTLKAICSGNEKDNRYFDWASADLPTRATADEKTEFIMAEFEELYRREVPGDDPAKVIAACAAPGRLRLKRPYELAPAQRFSPTTPPQAGLVVK